MMGLTVLELLQRLRLEFRSDVVVPLCCAYLNGWTAFCPLRAIS